MHTAEIHVNRRIHISINMQSGTVPSQSTAADWLGEGQDDDDDYDDIDERQRNAGSVCTHVCSLAM